MALGNSDITRWLPPHHEPDHERIRELVGQMEKRALRTISRTELPANDPELTGIIRDMVLARYTEWTYARDPEMLRESRERYKLAEAALVAWDLADIGVPGGEAGEGAVDPSTVGHAIPQLFPDLDPYLHKGYEGPWPDGSRVWWD